jgi:glycosyltransferase involved in cell wall biosynthesis
MNAPVYVFDPTASDEMSKVRGVGRYLQTMYEYLSPEFSFTKDINAVPHTHILINPFFNHLQKPLTIKKIARRQIAIIHDLIPFKYPKAFPIGIKGHIMKFLNNRALSNYDVIVTDSEESKKSIIQLLKIPQKKIRVIYATVPRLFLPHLDTQSSHHPFHKEKNTIVQEFSSVTENQFLQNNLKNVQDFILYVGDATWNKNLVNLAKAVQMANVTCICVGKIFGNKDVLLSKKRHPWQESFYQFMSITQKDPRFIFPGYLSDIELIGLYKKAKLNVLPSYDEGFGLSFIEAGYVSTPSVLSDIPIFREIAGKAAFFVDPKNPRDIAEKISQLFYDKLLHEKISVQAFSRAQDFNPNTFKNQWLDLINKLS